MKQLKKPELPDGVEVKDTYCRNIEFKESDDQKDHDDYGYFSGYAAVWDVKDGKRDIIVPGAFSDDLKEMKKTGIMPPLLWQHYYDGLIGAVDTLKEDDKGLFVEGRVAKKTNLGQEAFQFLKMDAIKALSIGYRAIASERKNLGTENEVRMLTKIKLYDISLVSIPANNHAKIVSVKSNLPPSNAKTLAALNKIAKTLGS